MASRFVNLTLHAVAVYDGDRVAASWPAGKEMARLTEQIEPAGLIATDQGDVTLVHARYADSIEGLPDPTPGTAYIVSRVLAATVHRPDVFFPFDEVRDASGRILGCRALGQFHQSAGGADA